MKLSFSTLGCPDWYWADILAGAKDLGYQGVELRGVLQAIDLPSIKAFWPENRTATRAQLERIGLQLPCATTSCELFDLTPAMQKLGKDTIDVAGAMGIPYVRMLADRGPAPGEAFVDEGEVLSSAQLLGEYAANAGVTVLIESNGVYASSEKLARLLQRVNLPSVAALWDVHHPYRYMGEPPQVTVDNLQTYLRHTHWKDSIRDNGVTHYRIMGQGDLPLYDFAGCLVDAGYTGYYSLEWVKRWDLTLEAPGIAFAQFVQFMRRLEM